MMGILLAVLIGAGLIWMLMPRRLGTGKSRSFLRNPSDPGWWGSMGYHGGSVPSSTSTDCSPGDGGGGGGGSCGGD